MLQFIKALFLALLPSREKKAYKAIVRAARLSERALQSAPVSSRIEMFEHLNDVWRICTPSEVLVRSRIQLDRIKAAAVQADRDRRKERTTEYEW